MSLLDAPLLQTAVGRFRVVSLLEGLSTVLLMGVAMPLKYLAGMPEVVRVVGSVHGALFLLFVAALVAAAREAGWGPWKAGAFLLLSTIPLGALVIEAQAREADPGRAEPA